MVSHKAHMPESQLNELREEVKASGILSFSFPHVGIFNSWLEAEWFKIESFIFRTKQLPNESAIVFYQLIVEKEDNTSNPADLNTRFFDASWWVEKVEVYERREIIDDELFAVGEELLFDHAIVFSLYLGEDKQRLCIGPMHWGGGLSATLDTKVIERIIDGCRVRWSA